MTVNNFTVNPKARMCPLNFSGWAGTYVQLPRLHKIRSSTPAPLDLLKVTHIHCKICLHLFQGNYILKIKYFTLFVYMYILSSI